MPLRIHEIFVSNDNEETQFINDLVNVLVHDHRSYKFNGSYQKNDYHLISYDICNKENTKIVFKLIFTLKNTNNGNELWDVDITIPNDNLITINFLDTAYDDNDNPIEYWDTEYEDLRLNVETVNTAIIEPNVIGKHSVSLSAIPFGEIKYARSLDELNHLYGFPIERNDEEGVHIINGFSERYTGIDMMIAKVITHEFFEFEVGERTYSCMIAQLETGFDKLPILIPFEFKDKIKDGDYIGFRADIKADLSVGENSYYNH